MITIDNIHQPQITVQYILFSRGAHAEVPIQSCLSHKRLRERLNGEWGEGAGVFTGPDIWRGSFEGTPVKRDTNISFKK